jgi:hypothetical protein
MDTRVDLHPMSPLGLTRTGRAPFLLLLNRRLNDRLHARLTYLPRTLIPVPDSAPSPGSPASPALSDAQHPPDDAIVNVKRSSLLTVRIGARRQGGAQPPSAHDANHRSSTSPRATDTVLKDHRRKRPSQPHPHMPPTLARAAHQRDCLGLELLTELATGLVLWVHGGLPS